MSTSVSDVPNSVFIDILSRLPLDTIGVCKCVSKTWRDLTFDPLFARFHSKRSPSSRYVMILDRYVQRAYRYDLQGENNLRLCRNLRIREFQYNETFIIGSCDGLILYKRTVNQEDLLFVYNPIVGKKIKLPAIEERNYERKDFTRYGIGYSRVSDEYKVIKVMELSGSTRVAMVHVLGDWDDWWRTTKNTPPSGTWWGDGGGVYVHGALYWFINDQSSVMGSICCFDVESEQFRLIPLPAPLELFRAKQHLHAPVDLSIDRSIDDDKLMRVWGDDSISVCYFEQHRLNIYIMKVDKVEKSSWVMEYSIKSEREICPLGKLHHGEILLMSANERSRRRRYGRPRDNRFPISESLFTYNPAEKRLKEVQSWVFYVAELVYAPSFLSPENF